MATAHERDLALQFAAEFVKKIRDMHDAPELLREEAKAILRHYPSVAQINAMVSLAAATD